MSNSEDEDRLIGTSEFSRLLDCHEVTIYKKLSRDPETGELHDPDFPQPIRGLGRRLKWWLSQAHAYIAARGSA
jgi:predicted DNA-binding transcriptional regulator AlpA